MSSLLVVPHTPPPPPPLLSLLSMRVSLILPIPVFLLYHHTLSPHPTIYRYQAKVLYSFNCILYSGKFWRKLNLANLVF